MVPLILKTGGLVLALLLYLWVVFGSAPIVVENRATWQNQVMPGKLSAAHAQLATNCAACHTAVRGIDNAKCVSCHAGNKALLARQPTAFHATIGNCAACHGEHQGLNANLRVMNHEALAQIGANLLPGALDAPHPAGKARLPPDHPLVSPLVAQLDCATCHATKDRHVGLFGKNCASCHGTTQWTIPTFQHPTFRSTDCAQCHQAPPSHYMGHFEMVDKTTAARGNACCGGVVVNQCYKCHQTTAWNDIKGVGYYKHH